MIDFKRKMVVLGGLPQKIHIKSENEKNPVTAVSARRSRRLQPPHDFKGSRRPCQRTFTMVAWDQRGSGGSYWGAKQETLTVDRLVEDANELVNWLCERFSIRTRSSSSAAAGGASLAPTLRIVTRRRLRLTWALGRWSTARKTKRSAFDFAMAEAVKAGDDEIHRNTQKSRPSGDGRLQRRLRRNDGAAPGHDEIRRLLAERTRSGAISARSSFPC